MFVKNAEVEFSKQDLFFCYSPPLKKYLCKIKNIAYISKGINNETKKSYWLFIKTNELSEALIEWSNNKEKG